MCLGVSSHWSRPCALAGIAVKTSFTHDSVFTCFCSVGAFAELHRYLASHVVVNWAFTKLMV